jgi:hypothetical protein
MSTQSQTQSHSQATQGEKEKPYTIVEFLDLDTECFTFLAPKANAHGGHFVPIRYNGKALYVRYSARTCPFGISTSTEKKDEYLGKYTDCKKITGYSTSVSCLKEYENDPYYQKAVELDEFFMLRCHENAMLWHLGGTATKPLSFDAIEGYDERGCDGKWKRMLKWSYKKNPQGEREYLDYPPRLEFGIPTTSMTEHQGKDGVMIQEAIFKTVFFDTTGTKLDSVNSLDGSTALPKFSRLATLSQWSTITQGTYGASLKPKAQQFRVFPSETLATDECLLNDDGEDEYDVGDQFGGSDVAVTRVSTSNAVVPPPMGNDVEEEENVEDEDETVVIQETVAPARVARATRRIVSTARKT